MKFPDYLPAVGVCLLLVALMALMLFATIHQPPPNKRAFVSDWVCESVDGYADERCVRRDKSNSN
jgi:hypothetical protein